MDTAKLGIAVKTAEGALGRLQQALGNNVQPAVSMALQDLQRELQNINALMGTSPAMGSLPTAKKYMGWRVLHKAEGGYDKNPPNMPNVIPPIDSRAIEMTREIQQMSFDLMKHFNPDITLQLWTKVHDHDRAFTNFNGFNKNGDPRANFITGENSSSPLPKYDKAQRLSGGQFVRGEVRGTNLVCIPGVHGIDANQPLPSIQTIIDNNWYLYAISLVGLDSKKVAHFPQGKGGPVVIPFIFGREIEFPLSLFEKWESDELPEILTMYR